MADGDLTTCQISIWFRVSVRRVEHVGLYFWMIQLEGVEIILFCFVNLSYSGILKKIYPTVDRMNNWTEYEYMI
jgi:hypothetical protein